MTVPAVRLPALHGVDDLLVEADDGAAPEALVVVCQMADQGQAGPARRQDRAAQRLLVQAFQGAEDVVALLAEAVEQVRALIGHPATLTPRSATAGTLA